MAQDYFKISKDEIHSTGFKIGVFVLFLLACIPVFMSYLGMKEIFFKNAPEWILIVYFCLGIFTVFASIGIYFLKKFAVYLYAFMVFALYILFLLAYNIELQDTIFTLFIFIGFGLLLIIPRWKFFT